MNKKMKFGMTALMVGVLTVSSVSAFAGTTGVRGAMSGHSNMVDLMLKDGVITQAQIDKYQKQMQADRQAEVKTAVQALVTKGTLTQAKADAVLKVVEANQAEMTALHEKLAGMTQEEVKAYLDKNPIQKSNSLLTLVENGTLTAAEHDAVRAVIGRGHGMGLGGPMGGKGHGGMGGRGMHAPANTNTTTTTAQ